MKNVTVTIRLLAIMLLLGLAALPGCGEKEETGSNTSVSGEDVKKETMEAYETTKDYTQEQIQAFREQTMSKLDEYGNKIDQLQAKAEELQGDAKVKAEEQLTALREKRDKVSEKLKELGSSSGNAWEDVKSGIGAAMEDLGNTYKKVVVEFTKP
ncbi:MAG: hypothetical protein JXA35_06695 [Deltaproteobacteria bacterium]|nr:hypothetical protein [Deltaproteobacteria bacterium]